MNPNNLNGNVKRGALENPFASNLEPFPWLNLQISIGKRRSERERRRGCSRFGRGECW
jgi:hypothetical protein